MFDCTYPGHGRKVTHMLTAPSYVYNLTLGKVIYEIDFVAAEKKYIAYENAPF